MGARVRFVEKEDIFKTGFELHVIGSCCLERGLERLASSTQFKTRFDSAAEVNFRALFVLYTGRTLSTAKCFVERVDSGKH